MRLSVAMIRRSILSQVKACDKNAKVSIKVQDDATLTHCLQELECAPPMFFQVTVPEDGVVDASLLVPEIIQDGVESPVVPVARPHEPLWVPQVPVSAPWGDERGEVAVLGPQWDTVVTIPSVHDCLPALLGEGHILLCWGVCDPFLPLAELVEWLEVYRTAGSAIWAPDAHHSLAPF